jgi:carbon storage regulator CsrA
MLVLTRKLQQQIKIGDEVVVTILRVKGNTVRVGVQAPRDVRVIRGELPKHGDQGEMTEILIDEDGSEIANLGPVLDDHVDAPAEEALKPAKPVLPLPHPAAAHLPLRRLHERRGAGPLKQIIASCGVLAK